MAGALYEEGGGFLTADGTMTLAFGRGYGGSTVVYTGTSLVPPQRVIDGWAVPGLAHADVAARCEKYKLQNNVHPLAPELFNDNNRLFVEGCRAAGFHAEQFPLNLKGVPRLVALQPGLSQRGQAGHQPGPASGRRAQWRRGRDARRGEAPSATARLTVEVTGRRRGREGDAVVLGARRVPRARPHRGDRRERRRLAGAAAALGLRRPAAAARRGLHLPPRRTSWSASTSARSPTTSGIPRASSWTAPPRSGSSSRPACTSRSPPPRTSPASGRRTAR